MTRYSMIGSLVALAMAGSIAVTYQALEAGPDPVRLRKRSAARPTAYRSPRGRLPHIGAKERARHAGKPDGAMHGLPPLHRKGDDQ